MRRSQLTEGYRHRLDPSLPLVLQRARPRRLLERQIRFALAGPAADGLWFPSRGYVHTPKAHDVVRFPDLPPLASAELVRLETRSDPIVLDEDQAWADVELLVGSPLAHAYFQWAAAETNAMVADAAATIERVADALLSSQALAPHEVRSLIRTRSKNMDWKPSPTDADAWFSDEELAADRLSEQDRAIAHREKFERAVAAAGTTDPDEQGRLYDDTADDDAADEAADDGE